MIRKLLPYDLKAALVIAVAVFVTNSQQDRATLRGLVLDERNARIVGASVSLIDAAGKAKTTLSNEDGVYVFNGVEPGKYIVRAAAKSFGPSDDVEIELRGGARQSLDLTLKVTIDEQK